MLAATLTEALTLWKDDCKRFKACLPEASHQESLLAGMQAGGAREWEEPQTEARTPMDAELKKVCRVVACVSVLIYIPKCDPIQSVLKSIEIDR